MNNQIDNKIPKHFKQKENNVSKAKNKSKHKHQYEECLIQYRFKKSDNIRTSLRSYCAIFGKIGNYLKNGKYYMDLKQLEKERYKEKPYYRLIPDKEIYKRYHDKLPVFFVEDIFKDEYVDFEQKQNGK